jgi:hypothetical protein
MKKVIVLFLVLIFVPLASQVEASPGNPVFGTVRFGPLLKYTDIDLNPVSIDIYIDDFVIPACPTCGLGGYSLAVVYDAALVQSAALSNGTFLGITGNGPNISCNYTAPPGTPSNVAFISCTTLAPPYAGPTGSGLLATLTFDPLAQGGPSVLNITDCPVSILPNCVKLTDIFAQYQVVPLQQNGSLVIGDYGSGDTDGDGCTDPREIGSNPATGGWRNPTDAYDFYDVPSPTLHDGGGFANRDKQVTNAKDLAGVLQYLGTSLNGPANKSNVDYDEDVNIDSVVDGRAYDRSTGPDWSATPDGAVNIIEDAMLASAQNGHNCN